MLVALYAEYSYFIQNVYLQYMFNPVESSGEYLYRLI
jgi:hypothetical protein